MMWIAAAAEVSGPLLISYFIDNMVAKHTLPLKLVAGLAVAYIGLQLLAALLHYNQSLLFNRAAVGVVQQPPCISRSASLIPSRLGSLSHG